MIVWEQGEGGSLEWVDQSVQCVTKARQSLMELLKSVGQSDGQIKLFLFILNESHSDHPHYKLISV